MSNEANLPDIQDYVSIKEAAQMLGLAYSTVHEYVSEGRIQAVRAADVILIPVAEVKRFKPKISGRPRTSIPIWRIAYEDNTLIQTSIVVRIRRGLQDKLKQRLEEIRKSKSHLFPGTTARYIVGNDQHPDLVEITLIWRSSIMPDEETLEQQLEAFRQELADILDWETAEYKQGTVFMHA